VVISFSNGRREQLKQQPRCNVRLFNPRKQLKTETSPPRKQKAPRSLSYLYVGAVNPQSKESSSTKCNQTKLSSWNQPQKSQRII
jgi:hypothetical protein